MQIRIIKRFDVIRQLEQRLCYYNLTIIWQIYNIIQLSVTNF